MVPLKMESILPTVRLTRDITLKVPRDGKPIATISFHFSFSTFALLFSYDRG